MQNCVFMGKVRRRIPSQKRGVSRPGLRAESYCIKSLDIALGPHLIDKQRTRKPQKIYFNSKVVLGFFNLPSAHEVFFQPALDDEPANEGVE